MKRLLRSVTFLATVSTVIGSLLIPVFFLSLEESVIAQQGVSLRNGYSMITLPDVGEQSDSWSCAPNSAARVLKFYGYRVSYGVMKGHIKMAQNIPGFESFGTTPSELRNAMRIYANDVILERESSFEKIIDLVSRGIPVITLVRVGEFKPAGIFSGTWPRLHWYVVSGYNAQSQQVYITDTDNNNGWISYDEFRSEWSWGIGRGLASSTLNSNGIKTRTMLWVDRTPNPCPNNNITIRPSSNLEFSRGKEWNTCSNYKFIFQNDGNLVLYNPSSRAIWATGTNHKADLFVVQADGNVVLYGGGRAVWTTNTGGNPGAFLAIQSDGNLVVYGRNHNVLWSTGTGGR